MSKEKKKPVESDLERRLREAGLDQEEIDEDALRTFLKSERSKIRDQKRTT